MRILLILAFFVNSCFAQRGAFFSSIAGEGTAYVPPTASPIGILNNESFGNSSGWTLSGTNDFNYNSKLDISGANDATYSKYITKDNSAFNFRHFVLEVTFVVKDVGAGSYGFGVGFKSQNTWIEGTSMIQVSTASGTITPFLTYRGANAGATVFSGGSHLSASLNDVCKFVYTQSDGVGLLVMYNQTASTSISYPAVVDFQQNTNKLAVWSIGGTHQINNIKLSSDYLVGNEIMFIGNSITTGSHAGVFANHFSYNVGSYYSSMSVCSGGGDRTVEVLLALPRILQLQPKRVIIEIGTNNFGSGLSKASFIAELNSIVSQLQSVGASVFVLYIGPRGDSGIIPWNTDIASNVSSTINIYTGLLGSGSNLNPSYDFGDGLHWNAAGHALVGNTIRAYLGI
jgi:hypothetical protein